MKDFTGKVALVTGAGSGIGRAIALELARRGADVSLIGRRREPLEQVRAECESCGIAAKVLAADVGREEDVRALTASVAELDILIHSAGVIHRGTVAETSVAEFDEQFNTNCRGPFLLTQSLLPLLRRRTGQVVFINSSAGVSGRGDVGAYCASKHALRGLADSLREEVNREGIRVLSVYCGRTASPMQAALQAAEGRVYQPENLLQPEDIAAVIAAALALPLTAEVTDIHLRPRRPNV